jgi:putative FmdB family regulatory protein
MWVVPIYEYECEKCQGRFELLQKFNERAVKQCVKCGGPVHKVLSPPALVFKGTGWYVTDYGRAGRKGAEKADRDSNGGSKKSESSPAKSGSKDD